MPNRRKRKKVKTQKNPTEDTENVSKVPRSMVFKRGKVGLSVQRLVADMRGVMLPYTAAKLKENKKNTLKDFVSVAAGLHVSHLMAFTQSSAGINMRIMKTPHGPTLTYRVLSYSLAKDIVNIQKRPHAPGIEFQYPPLIILNNFGSKSEANTIQSALLSNMFPAIDVQNIHLADCRRILLLTLDSDTNEIYLRHYVVNASPVGLTKSVKKIIKGQTPNLHNVEDIADWIENPGNLSDSEVEDSKDNRITLSQNFVGRGNRESHKSAIRLKELGPRMTLKLLKIEAEIGGGLVLFHSEKKKTQAEIDLMKKRKLQRQQLKQQRKKEQERNIQNKLKRKQAGDGSGSEPGSEEDDYAPKPDDQDEEDDDVEWYRKEVGEEPDASMFARNKKRRVTGKGAGSGKGAGKGSGGKGKGKGKARSGKGGKGKS